MKKYLTRKNIVLALSLTLITFSAIVISWYNKSYSANTKLSTSQNRVDNGVVENPLWQQQMTMPELIQSSTHVIMGTASGNIARLMDDEQTVITDFRIRVNQVFKGNLQQGSYVVVTLPGGAARKSNGNLRVVTARGFKRMNNSLVYVLFLNEDTERPGSLIPVNGPQGLFEIPNDGTKVKHLGRPLSLPPQDPNDPNIPNRETFLRQLYDLLEGIQ